jgi:large subunit ribosomal protein L4
MELAMQTGGQVAVSDAAFGAEFNEGLVHQVVTAYLAAGRAGTKAQKTRSDVRGGGRKPWKQKGSGNARAGTIRSPLWRGGGKVFAARPRSHAQKVNRKMYRVALRAIFSELARQGRLLIVEQIEPATHKTKDLSAWLTRAGVSGRTLILVSEASRNLQLAVRNLPGVSLATVSLADPVSLVGHDQVVVSRAAVAQIGEWLK